MININNIREIEQIIDEASVIAVVGLSPKTERPSNMVARYLIDTGFKVIPVNPGQSEVLGEKCYPSVLDVPEEIDIVNIFRKSEDVGPIAKQAIAKGCKTIWMQQGIVNHEAAAMAREHGIKVVMDRCIKIDHSNLTQKN